jgi:hypothetical protein
VWPVPFPVVFSERFEPQLAALIPDPKQRARWWEVEAELVAAFFLERWDDLHRLPDAEGDHRRIVLLPAQAVSLLDRAAFDARRLADGTIEIYHLHLWSCP